MNKYFYFLFLSLSVISNLFSQEVSISTTFSQDGELYKNRNDTSIVVTKFEANEACFVIGYLGKDMYKVKYKDSVGFVDSQYLVFNDEIDDLFYAFQDAERIKTIKQEELRRKKIREIVNNGAQDKNEVKTQDSIAKVKEEENKRVLEQEVLARKLEAERVEKVKQDSITKVKEDESKRVLEHEALAKKLEVERIEKVKQDSIAKVKEAENKRVLEQEVLARKLEVERIEKVKQDSIAKVKEAENKRVLEQEALARKLEAERIEKVKQDSIAKVKEEENKRVLEQEVLAKKLEVERIEKVKQDSIAKVKEEENKRVLEHEALAKKLEVERIEKVKQDSITKVKEEETRRVLEREALARKLETERIENVKRDSITKTKAESKVDNELDAQKELEKLKRNKFRNTCQYAMNEYDAIDRIKIIRTDPYQIADNLTVELFKRGSSVNVFFNLTADLGCASYLPNNRSYVKVTLENNKTITFYHSWDMDCGDFRFKGVISKSQISLLQYSPIKSIFLKGTKYSRNITNIEYREVFIDKLKCIE